MTPEDTALADRLEETADALKSAGYENIPEDILLAVRRLRELGAEVERLTEECQAQGRLITAMDDAGLHDKLEGALARIAELETERAWRPACETCIHWKFDEPDWEFDKLRFGECKAIRMREHIADAAREGLDRFSPECDAVEEAAVAAAKAIAVDGSGYYAAIRTAPDFGCTLYSPLPSPPTDTQEGK